MLLDPREQALFLSGYGDAGMSPDYLSRLVAGYVRRAGIARGGCHLFRHSCATLMLENGADIRLIQQMLGHANLNTTQIYTEVTIAQLRRVHAMTHPAAAKTPGDGEEARPLPPLAATLVGVESAPLHRRVAVPRLGRARGLRLRSRNSRLGKFCREPRIAPGIRAANP